MAIRLLRRVSSPARPFGGVSINFADFTSSSGELVVNSQTVRPTSASSARYGVGVGVGALKVPPGPIFLLVDADTL